MHSRCLGFFSGARCHTNPFAHSPAHCAQALPLLILFRPQCCSACTGIRRTPPKLQTDGTARDHFLGAGRTALSRPLPDSTLPFPGYLSKVEVQEHCDNFFEVRVGRGGLSFLWARSSAKHLLVSAGGVHRTAGEVQGD